MRDRIFEGIAHRFLRNIYGTQKGMVRLEILWRDLQTGIPGLAGGRHLDILDVGAGVGQVSHRLATLGHRPLLVEPGGEMRRLAARYWAETEPVMDAPRMLDLRLQGLPGAGLPQSDLVLCHAVLEWLAEPEAALPLLIRQVKPGGWLSLMFYNRHAAVWSNLMLGNLEKVQQDRLRGRKKRLTPINPLEPERMLALGQSLGLELVSHSGVRCFVDYMKKDATDEAVIETEWMLARREPYRSLARYVHLLYRRP